VDDTSGDSFQVAALIVKEFDGLDGRIEETIRDSSNLEGEVDMFSKWMREKMVRRTIRLG
jgi:hypothetical protein